MFKPIAKGIKFQQENQPLSIIYIIYNIYNNEYGKSIMIVILIMNHCISILLLIQIMTTLKKLNHKSRFKNEIIWKQL